MARSESDRFESNVKISVVRFGKPAFGEYKCLVDTYQKRLRRQISIESVELKSRARATSVEDLDEIFFKDTFVVCLDQKGQSYSSEAFAENLKLWLNLRHLNRICFLIGGPYGLSEKCKAKAQQLWKLSDHTLTADLAWLIVWEQIYRGFSINSGGSYHHG